MRGPPYREPTHEQLYPRDEARSCKSNYCPRQRQPGCTVSCPGRSHPGISLHRGPVLLRSIATGETSWSVPSKDRPSIGHREWFLTDYSSWWQK